MKHILNNASSSEFTPYVVLNSDGKLYFKAAEITPPTEDNEVQIPNNEIWYTSTDGNIIDMSHGTTPISNTYKNGKGVMVFAEDLTQIEDFAFDSCGSLASIIIPSSVTSINMCAFFGCGSLASITIPSGVTRIESYAFDSCGSLASITIPSSVTYIDQFAFGGVSKVINQSSYTRDKPWGALSYEEVN